MRKRFLLPAVLALLVGLAELGRAEPARAFAGCNQNCIGSFPGECEFYYLNYFCHNANPPWTVCEAELNESCEIVE